MRGKSIHVFTFISFQEPARFLFSKIDFRNKIPNQNILINYNAIYISYTTLSFIKLEIVLNRVLEIENKVEAVVSIFFTRGVNLKCFEMCMIVISISTNL